MRKFLLPVFLLCMAATVVLFSACEKDEPSLEDQITGKWIMKTAIGSYTTQGVNTKDTTRFTSADYFEFKADGSLDIVETKVKYTGKWKIDNNKVYITDTKYIDYKAGLDITLLTETQLQLYYKESNTTSTLEQKLNLTK